MKVYQFKPVVMTLTQVAPSPLHTSKTEPSYCLRSFDLSFSYASICNCLSEFCIEYCFKCFISQWLEIVGSYTQLESLDEVPFAFDKQTLGEPRLVAKTLDASTQNMK